MARGKRAMISGGMVAMNHVASGGVTLVSALLLSKYLGPEIFAIYVFCTSLIGLSRVTGRLGINACLLAQNTEPEEIEYGTALTLMLISSVIVFLFAVSILPLLEKFSRISDLFWPGVASVAVLPLHVFSLPAIARMERRLMFKPVLAIELSSQILGQCTGIALAYGGMGIWGPLAGWGLRTVYCAVLPWVVIGVMPRLAWHMDVASRMLKYGLGYVVATSISQSRGLIILAVVGRVVGQEAVGYIGLTLRAVGLIAPFRSAVSRVILPALAPVVHLPGIKRKVHAVVEIELLLSVPVTVLATLFYAPLVEFIGPAWWPTIKLFPLVASGALLASAHATALSLLHIRGFFKASICGTGLTIFANAVAILILGKLWGVIGCAVAAIVIWPSFWLQEWFAFRKTGTSLSVNGVLWAIGGVGACLSNLYGIWWLLLPLFSVLLTYSSIIDRIKEVYYLMAVSENRSENVSVG